MYLLSVIIPVYNTEAYLVECLQSILNSISEHEDRVEIILVDDGSTDYSGNLCDKYSNDHRNIRTVHKKNGGVASARIVGLDLATGKYIAWVDPDDYVAPDWFCHIDAVIAQGEPDVIVVDTLRFGAGGEKPEIYGRAGGFVDSDVFLEDVIRDIRMLSGLPNKVMKAELFETIQFDETCSMLEDYKAMPEILCSVKSVYYIPECLYFYRQHPKSLLHGNSATTAFGAVQTAMDRMLNVDPKYFRAAVTAAAWQAFRFCRNHYLNANFGASKEQLAFCGAYVRKHLLKILTDDISWTLKIKMCLLGCGLYKLICYIKRKLEGC